MDTNINNINDKNKFHFFLGSVGKACYICINEEKDNINMINGEKKHFTIKELFRAGFKIVQDGGFSYLYKKTFNGEELVSQDFDDISSEKTDKPFVKIWKLKDSIKEEWETALTKDQLMDLITPVI